MSREVRDGRIYEIVYDVETVTPSIPARKHIANASKPQAQQKFEPTQLPKNFAKLPLDEQVTFIDQEFARRRDGYWLYINGELTWLPGGYYFELCYWKIDIGLKQYRDRDRRKWLFWDTCVKDANCFGCLYMKHRRDGATYWAGCIQYETLSRTVNGLGGIQSKTGKDAAKVFNKAVVMPFRKLPGFFVPIFDGNDRPKTELSFSQPAQKITKTQRGIQASEALDSSITWWPTVEEAPDGQKMVFYHGDEWGKTVEMKVSKAWQIIRECLSTGAGTRIVGKALITSTVAEGTKKGGAEFKKLWDGSDPKQRNKNRRTLTGLYRLFLMAADGLEGFIGEYGESIINAPTPSQLAYLRRTNPDYLYDEETGALQHILNEREGLREAGDTEKLAEHRRLYPLTESDAFTPPAAECLFDAMKLDDQSDVLLFEPTKRWVRGEFLPVDKDEPDGDARFVLTEKGNWYVLKSAIGYDERTRTCTGYEHANRYIRRGDLLLPANKTFGCGGVDPVDHDGTTDQVRASKFAMAVFRKHDSLDPHNSNRFIALYVHRAKKAEMMYEDALQCAKYWGVELLIENQKPGFENYLKQRGYWAYAMARPKHTHTSNTKAQKAKGVPASDLIHVEIHDEWEAYICDYCENIDFEDIIEDLKNFDINDTRKSDLTMAGGYALIANRKFKPKTAIAGASTNQGKSYVKVYQPRSQAYLG